MVLVADRPKTGQRSTLGDPCDCKFCANAGGICRGFPCSLCPKCNHCLHQHRCPDCKRFHDEEA